MTDKALDSDHQTERSESFESMRGPLAWFLALAPLIPLAAIAFYFPESRIFVAFIFAVAILTAALEKADNRREIDQ